MNFKNRNYRAGTVALTVLSLALAPVAVAGKKPGVAGNRLDFTLTDLDGNVVDSRDDRFIGKVLLVELWGTWCQPCISEIPTFVDLQRRNRDDGLVIVAIAFEDQETAEARREHLRGVVIEHGINYLVLDGGRPADLAKTLPGVRGVKGFPVEIVVDRRGNVVSVKNGYGYKKKWARKLEEQLDTMLSSRY